MAFNKRFLAFNTGLVLVAACVFATVTGSLDAGLLVPVITAIWLDYRSQSSIAVLITGDNNWKIPRLPDRLPDHIGVGVSGSALA